MKATHFGKSVCKKERGNGPTFLQGQGAKLAKAVLPVGVATHVGSLSERNAQVCTWLRALGVFVELVSNRTVGADFLCLPVTTTTVLNSLLSGHVCQRPDGCISGLRAPPLAAWAGSCWADPAVECKSAFQGWAPEGREICLARKWPLPEETAGS